MTRFPEAVSIRRVWSASPLGRHRLGSIAAEHRRSLNFEVISYLEQMTPSTPIDAESLLARARAVRRIRKGVRLNDRLFHDFRVGF